MGAQYHIYDTHRLSCSYCKHVWILVSNGYIKDEEYDNWIKEALIQHTKIHQGSSNE